MRILVTNDDGIYAQGLWILARELSRIAEVIAVAPDREQSAVGTAVTLRRPLIVQQITPLIEGIKAYSVEGTPSDSVILGLGKVAKEKIDLVVSGINNGSNLGEDVLISGTVGAALAAHLRGFSAIAVSSGKADAPNVKNIAKFVTLLAKRMSSTALPSNIFLNINFPDLPLAEIKGIRIARLASKSHINTVEEGHDGKRTYYMLIRNSLNKEVDKRTDVWAINQGEISITPLHIFLANRIPSSIIEGLCAGLLEELRK